MKFDDTFLSHLRERLPLSRVLSAYVRWDQKRSNPSRGDFWACCPFHHEKTPSFHVDDQKGFYHCFSCKASGDHFTFLLEKEGLSFPEAVERLADQAGLPLPTSSTSMPPLSLQKTQWYEVMEYAQRFFQRSLSSKNGTQARDYLIKRGISPAIWEYFGLGYAPAHGLEKDALQAGFTQDLLCTMGLLVSAKEDRRAYDRFRNRLMFPIYDSRGRPIAFGGRTLSPEGTPKYLNSPETPLFQKREVLYHLHQAKPHIHQHRDCFVVEGYLDVVALVEAGFPHCVAALGTALSPEQLQKLWAMAPEPTVCFDGDSPGRAAAHRLLDQALPLLAAGRSLKFVFFPSGQDPDSLFRTQGLDALKQCLHQHQPLIEVLWQRHLDLHDHSTPERRAFFEKTLHDLVATITDSSVRTHYHALFKERLKTLFSPPPRPFVPFHTSGKGKTWEQETKPSLSLKASSQRTQTQTPQEKQECFILLACLEYPFLLEDYTEPLGNLAFSTKELDSLMQEILNRTALYGAQESPSLKDFLKAKGYGPSLFFLETHLDTLKLSFLKPGAPWETIRAGFEHLLMRHHEAGVLHVDLKKAQDLLASDPTPENLQKLHLIRHALLDHRKKSFLVPFHDGEKE